MLKEGLKRTSRGEKGDDSLIIRVDALLDSCRPDELRQAGVSRDDNVYGYVADGDCLIDITDGRAVKLSNFINRSDQAVLRLHIEPERCYVSDLDAYDKVADAFGQGAGKELLRQLARRYWTSVRGLQYFGAGDIRRPEVMITYDIPPDAIEQLT